MYPVLGNTGIELYGLLNIVAGYLIYIYNVCHFRSKNSELSNLSSILIKQSIKNDKFVFLAKPTLWLFLECLLISHVQLNFLGGLVHKGFGNLVQTSLNYYGTLFIKPVFLFILFYFIATNPLKKMDLITPAYPLALVVTKLACFCYGCCNGFECSWGLYNHNSLKREFPTQLVEAGLALCIFLFLMWYKKRAKEGTMFPIYLILYSATRFFSEFTRNDSNRFGPLKIYHLLCIAGVIIGIIELLIVFKFADKIKALYNRNPLPWIKEKNIVHHKNNKKKKNYQTAKAPVKKDYSKYKMWGIIWTLGLIGQTSWCVEGTWFNTFVYEKIDKNPSIITPMLIASALATTVSIFLFGTLTDRTGNRRKLISTGFVLWGILTACFGLTQFIANKSLILAIISIVLIDMLLSFFGSMSTDVGYSTWLTDIMNEKNRGQIGGAIAVQSVLGSLLANVIGGFLVGKENNYIRLFAILGIFMSVFGIISIFLFSKKDDVKPSVNGSFSKQFFSVFSFRTLIKHKEIMWVYVVVSVFFIGHNTYMPHVGNYLLHYLGFSADKIGIIQAVPLIMAMLVTLPVSKYLNKGKYTEVSTLALICCITGALSIFTLIPEQVDTSKVFVPRLFLAVFLIGSAYIIMLQTTKVWTKNLYPEDAKGQFEGFYAISYALLPMIFGSGISQSVIKNGGETMLNELTGRLEYIPNGKIFITGALISLLSIIPILMTKRYSKKNSDNV